MVVSSAGLEDHPKPAPAELGELEEILRRFKAKTTQEAIYLELEHDVDLRMI